MKKNEVAKGQKPARTQETRVKIRAASRIFHDANIQRTYERVRQAMSQIQADVDNNRDVYPQNKGVVSQAEVARRAGIHPVTLHKPHYSALVKEVQAWVAQIKAAAVVGHKRVRRDLQSRVAEHEQVRAALVESLRISEVDLEHSKQELAELTEKFKLLEEENRQLRLNLSRSAPLKLIKPVSKSR